MIEVLDVGGHSSDLLKQIHELQLKDILCDVRLGSERGSVSAHRIVLMAASPYLRTRLSTEYRAGRGKDNVNFFKTPLVLIERVVRYIYTGKLEVCKQYAELLKLFCEDLELAAAVQACSAYIKSLEDGKPCDLDAKEPEVPVVIVKEEQSNEEKLKANQTEENTLLVKNRRVQKVPCKRTKPNNTEDQVDFDELKIEINEDSPVKKKRGRPKLPPDQKGKYTPNKHNLKMVIKLPLNIPTESDTGKSDDEVEDQDIIIPLDNIKVEQTIAGEHDPIDEVCAEQIRVALKDLGHLAGIDEEVLNAPVDLNDDITDPNNDVANNSFEPDEQTADIDNDNDAEDYSSDDTIVDDLDKDQDYKTEPEKKTKAATKKSKILYNKNGEKRKTYARKKKTNTEIEQNGTIKKRSNYIKVRKTKVIPCSMCSKVFNRQKRLLFHEYHKHGAQHDFSNYKRHHCPEEGCDYVTDSRNNLNTHRKGKHSEERPNICEFCGKGFKLPAGLASHRNIHNGEKKWKCETCGEGFNQQSGLRIHIKRYHMGEDAWAELCHLCSEKFVLKAELIWHLYRYHDIPLPPKYKAHNCDICNYLSKSQQDLERHMNRHKGIKPFVCTICQKGCSTKNELQRHVNFHGEKNFKCTFEECTFACTDAIGLEKHVRLRHTHKDVKPYACPVCPYRTGVRGNVDKHIRQVHHLIVITKHTMDLKMKYKDFSSGDVVTKDGELVATSKERKELERLPQEDQPEEKSKRKRYKNHFQSTHGNPQTSQNETETSLSVKTITGELAADNLQTGSSDFSIPAQQETRDNRIQIETQSSSVNEMGGVSDRYLASLANYTMPEPMMGISSTATMGMVGVPVAQDLRMTIGNQSTAVNQAEMYSMDQNSAMFNKYQYLQ